jgi:formiminoglutamase
MPEDPRWPRAGAWLAGGHHPEPVARLAVLGAPVRLGSLSGGRFDLAPAAIRDGLHRFSTFDGDVDVRTVAARDAEDLRLSGTRPEHALQEVAAAVGGILDTDDAVVILGGDNSVTRPACLGLGPDLTRVGLLTLDAHHDVRDTDGGLNNGNPVRALLDDGLPGGNIVQVGIQPFANSEAYAEVAGGAGISVVTASEARARGMDRVVGEVLHELGPRVDAVYVDLDVDVLDRAFAPASPGSRPGGLTPAEVQTAVRLAGAHPRVRAMDIVEVDPERDVADVTVLAAASFLLCFAAGLASRFPRDRMASARDRP